jgi:hypothetical protein
MITTDFIDYTDFSHELKRIARIRILYYVVGMFLLMGSFGNYAFGCCDLICPPCEVPDILCTTCLPTGCPSCGHWCCCSPWACNNNTCCPPDQPIGHGWTWGGSEHGWLPICCPSDIPEWCSSALQCYDPGTQECCGSGICYHSACQECKDGSCQSKCKPENCEFCKNGACLPGFCVYAVQGYADYSCTCDGGSCHGSGAKYYFYMCYNDYCLTSGCYCKETRSSQLVEEDPICDHFPPPGSACDINADCIISGWTRVYGNAVDNCYCTHD